MILTVTLNPLLERRYKFSKVKFFEENRHGISELKAGGKGINVSRQLNFLSSENVALTFLGGTSGKQLKETLIKEDIKITSVRTESSTRDASIIIDESLNKISTFFEKNSAITPKEAEEFKLKMEKMIQNCEIVVFSGSSPCPEADSIFRYGIELANNLDKISVLDTYGDHLRNCLEASPTVIHNNISELENSLHISLREENEKLEFLNSLYIKGIKQAFLSDGNKPLYAANFDFHYKVIPPKINVVDSTGSGDAFVAGIVHGLEKDFTFEESVINAVSLGALNASEFNVCSVKPSEIEKVKDKIAVQPVGKKMKIINDSPN